MKRWNEKNQQNTLCDLQCKHLVSCKEDYDNDILGYCAFKDRRLLGFLDEISSGGCDCIHQEGKEIVAD